MKLVHSDPYSAHQDVFLLLPWYVNKTLHGSELNLVKEHLKLCLTCKREIASLQKLSLIVNQPGPIDSAQQAAFAQLKNRLHKTNPSNPKLPAHASVIHDQHKRHKRPDLTHWQLPRSALAMAAALVLSLFIPAYITLDKLLSDDYRTLSDGGPAMTNSNEIHIVFSDDTSKQQINSLLASISGQILERPSQVVYSVSFKQARAKEEIVDMVAQLRKNPQVIFAEPVYAVLSSTQSGSTKK